ncbi:hypothetical protein SAMN04487970_10931 [Paenibacillus tianmuensis]|uniref:Uncharacterized protein n=1 Tax=Paenibacillus tianmuensis TaxID=624147 RepID=A0A1G4U1C5_9BACL|nr:hypothetical protein [Paenibacillus tianmuensis]SCW87456.1 hypothetical protein SAMN04487970_10931 [Paenibacillus tianmuensis]
MLKDNPHPYGDAELYMELEGMDIRIAIMKVTDFLQTLGDASLSLTYSDKTEHVIDDERLLNIISGHILDMQ